jgi:hypothetical protein
VWHSGGGLHCLWVTVEPFDLGIAQEAEQAGSLLRRLAACLAADGSAAETARVLRVPKTLNHKPEYGTPREVVVEVFEPTRRYNPSDFDMILPAEPATVSRGPFTVPAVVGPSERNPTLFALGRSLKLKKIAPPAILEALKATNAAHCQPPHPESEVLRVFDSIMKRRDRVQPVPDASAAAAAPLHIHEFAAAVAAPPQEDPAPTEAVAEATAEATAEAAPSPAVMDVATLLDDTARYLRRFVVMSDQQSATVALWVAHTHTFLSSEATPYLHVTAATKRAGKTLLLEILEPLAAKPWLTGRTTAAALTRKIDAQKPTLLLDETGRSPKTPITARR